jgi:hypothetical protein
VSTNWRDEAKALEQRLMIVQDHYAELARALGSPAGGFWSDPTETHAEILQRAEQLAELDAFVAAHQYVLDKNPPSLWPKQRSGEGRCAPRSASSVWWSGAR